jgi:hypothetical protein
VPVGERLLTVVRMSREVHSNTSAVCVWVVVDCPPVVSEIRLAVGCRCAAAARLLTNLGLAREPTDRPSRERNRGEEARRETHDNSHMIMIHPLSWFVPRLSLPQPVLSGACGFLTARAVFAAQLLACCTLEGARAYELRDPLHDACGVHTIGTVRLRVWRLHRTTLVAL